MLLKFDPRRDNTELRQIQIAPARVTAGSETHLIQMDKSCPYWRIVKNDGSICNHPIRLFARVDCEWERERERERRERDGGCRCVRCVIITNSGWEDKLQQTLILQLQQAYPAHHQPPCSIPPTVPSFRKIPTMSSTQNSCSQLQRNRHLPSPLGRFHGMLLNLSVSHFLHNINRNPYI